MIDETKIDFCFRNCTLNVSWLWDSPTWEKGDHSNIGKIDSFGNKQWFPKTIGMRHKQAMSWQYSGVFVSFCVSLMKGRSSIIVNCL